jgi:4-hydroxyphenylpyruvate dioxygenase
MPDLFDNPLGLDGFEFLEFCAPEKGVLEAPSNAWASP